ncbi:MAG: hypothetical protein HKN77_07815 [Woeseiaceae bacterium]|nr:hypothetical protein [Woeseiaceae bacterium]
MPYQSDIQVVDGYVRAEVTGARIPATAKSDHLDTFKKIRDVVRRANTKRLLLVSKLTGPLAPMLVFDFTNDPEKIGWSRNQSVALVGLSESARDALEMIELLAVNRDMPVKLFDDENSAIAWLNQQPGG